MPSLILAGVVRACGVASVIDRLTSKAGVVDPVEPETVAKAVKDAGVTLECVLTTHSVRTRGGGSDCARSVARR